MMIHANQSLNISTAIQSLKDALDVHNSTFDEANGIFSEVEMMLKQLNAEYWYPYYLSPQTHLTDYSPVPFNSSLYGNGSFEQITYNLGFVSGRLVISKITTKYEFIRGPYGQVLLAPNNLPHMNKVSETIDKPIIASDSSRALRVMAIEHLPGFLNYISSSLATHTNTLTSALSSIKSIRCW